MQTKREHFQQEMTLLPPLESLIPEDHYLRRLDRVLDLSFVHEAVRDRYCADNGRPSIDPEVVLRLFILQAVMGIRSVRELMREVQLHLGYRWFIGYRLDEKLPDHSTLSKALDRFGNEVINEIFERSIAQCKKSGLIEGRVLHVDATTIRADLDADRVGRADSPDPDARFGRFPSGGMQPGYKQQAVVDAQLRVVVGVSVNPANRAESSDVVAVVDHAVEHIGLLPKAVCADSAYASGANRAAFDQRGIRLVSPPRSPRNHHSARYFTIEEFTYDASRDRFECPAGHILRFAGPCGSRPGRRKYRASITNCKNCSLKAQCTKAPQRCLNVSVHHAALVQLRADSRTASFWQLYRTRAPAIEGVFAEAKQWHGLRRAWRRGLAKMRVQCLLIAAVINFKRLITFFSLWNCGYPAIIWTFRSIWRALFRRGLQMPRCRVVRQTELY